MTYRRSSRGRREGGSRRRLPKARREEETRDPSQRRGALLGLPTKRAVAAEGNPLRRTGNDAALGHSETTRLIFVDIVAAAR